MFRFRGSASVLFCLAVFFSGQAFARPDWAGGPGGNDGGGTPPVLSFAADSTEHALGDRVQLSWASDGTRFCQASGDWSGKFDTVGAYWTQPLDGPKAFTLKCVSSGGGVESTVYVSTATASQETAPAPEPDPVPAPDPAPVPILTFTSADSEVLSGGSTTLSWSATDADGCTAGDAWGGSFGPTGTQSVGPLDATSTFTLTCTGAGGSTDASLMVAVTEPQPAPAPEPAPEPTPVPAPTVALSASLAEIAVGGSTTLTWSATDADGCAAGGGWGGSLAASGSQVINAIQTSTSYSLTCSGAGGSASASTSVTVVPAPSVALTSAEPAVAAGGMTTLSWTSTYSDTCQATGGWSGARAPEGWETVGPIGGSTTFTMTCTGVGGTAVQMVSVSAIGQVTISWVAPTENVDGSPLTDLDSFRIYYGPDTRSYTNSIDVLSPSATSYSFDATSGDYYVTMTALDGQGNESAYANEIVRSVP